MRTVVLCLVLVCSASWASAKDTTTLANELGTVLAAEEFCDLSFDQAAIGAFIDKNVRATDMSFASMLNLMISGHKVSHAQMGAAQKTAHCRQVARVAKSLGFTK